MAVIRNNKQLIGGSLSGKALSAAFVGDAEAYKIPEVLFGPFTVNDQGKQVMFSRGNLFWYGTKFAFEGHQYDCRTSWDVSHIGHFYWSKDAAIARAETYNDPEAAVTDKFFAVDGGAIEGYTVLDKDEWQYLIDNAFVRIAIIAGIHCVVLKPDGFNSVVADTYTAEEWAEAEKLGLVALPVPMSSMVGYVGYFWSASPYPDNVSRAYYACFISSSASVSYGNRRISCPARLVKIVE